MVRPRCSTWSIGFTARTVPDSCSFDVLRALHCTIPWVLRPGWRPLHHLTRMGQMPRIAWGKCNNRFMLLELDQIIWWFFFPGRHGVPMRRNRKSQRINLEFFQFSLTEWSEQFLFESDWNIQYDPFPMCKFCQTRIKYRIHDQKLLIFCCVSAEIKYYAKGICRTFYLHSLHHQNLSRCSV